MEKKKPVAQVKKTKTTYKNIIFSSMLAMAFALE
jgi:hypothetical protein